MLAIKVEKLTKRYGGLTAVNHISFDVERGSMLGFLGINGAGKTTVINMLSALIKPDEGEVNICGCQLGKDDDNIRKKIGIVYQQNYLDDILTVRENLMCRGIIHGINKSCAKKQIDKLTEILKLEDILDKRYKYLSGGQKRRSEIAAALMHTPEILFLDEPATGLDPATRIDVWETVKALQKREKMTVFLTTHYMEEAAGADYIIIMDKGNIIASGAPFSLKERYAKDKLRLFFKNAEMKEILLNSTMDAIDMLEKERKLIQGFEVIQGNMDDVFLNAVGKSLQG